jgi:hypothetical protein
MRSNTTSGIIDVLPGRLTRARICTAIRHVALTRAKAGCHLQNGSARKG